jgi:hypothetical protein
MHPAFIRKPFFLSCLFIAIGCSTPRVNYLAHQHDLARDLDIVDHALEILHNHGNNTWPGFGQFRATILLSREADQLLLLTEQAPSRFSEAPSSKFRKLPIWISQNRYSPGGAIMSSTEVIAEAFPKLIVSTEFKTSILAISSLKEFQRLGTKWNENDWMPVLWHEYFHLFQEGNYAEVSGLELPKYRLLRSTLESLVADEHFRTLLLQELKIIEQILFSEVNMNDHQLCRKLVEQRHKRFSWMSKKNSDLVVTENFWEGLEGTARYVEEKISLSLQPLNSSKPTLESRFKHPNIEKNYFYETGFGISLVLDRLSNNWKARAFKQPGFLTPVLEENCR